MMDEKKKIKLLEAILNSINEGVIATDREGKIIVYNKQLAEFEGLDPKEVMGKQLKDVYDWNLEKSEHMRVFKTGKPLEESNYKTSTVSGRQNFLIAKTLPLYEDDKVVVAYSISRNVTKIREMYNRSIELQPKSQNSDSQSKNGTRFTFGDMIFVSKKMELLKNESQKAALSPSPVLIHGETGTGKEIIVQSIHNASPNKNYPFIGINCAAIPESLLESMLFGTTKGAFTGAENKKGLFQQAEEGTVYLDEINSMPMNLQAKLLRVIQEKTFRKVGGSSDIPLKCKIISSVNKDPLLCVQDNQLRQDLYYRLSVITLFIPPLRDRREDILPLAEHFASNYKEIYGKKEVKLNKEAKEVLLGYSWPGNVRELEHVVERVISMMDDEGLVTLYNLPQYLRRKLNETTNSHINMSTDIITDDIGDEISKSFCLNNILRDAERNAVLNALKSSNNNITQAAKSLGIGRQNLQYRMKKLNIKQQR